MENILWLKQLKKEDIPKVGGKGANLGEMYNARLPVPPAFVVSANAFKNFLKEAKLRIPINSMLKNLNVDNNEELQDASEKIQDLILNTEMPEDIKHDIVKSYNNMDIDLSLHGKANKTTLEFIKAGRSAPYVAVRSSATEGWAVTMILSPPCFASLVILLNIS